MRRCGGAAARNRRRTDTRFSHVSHTANAPDDDRTEGSDLHTTAGKLEEHRQRTEGARHAASERARAKARSSPSVSVGLPLPAMPSSASTREAR